ncbi:protein Sap1p [[Candida] jaroonii]|uniref:Protein Sap1p n=1 Tax=[Candida] jaroonii TaxID=467808 RepID=A0ACA9YBR7_9ASCO|nr:protein Sap1p [[Candida] jaroonii]
MFKKKQLSVIEELRETYDDCVNLTLKNIMYEEQDRLEDSLKGWKSLHTSLLFKLELFEKNLTKMSKEEVAIFQELKSIRDQNVKHLIRVQLKLDELNKKKPVKVIPPPKMSVPSLRNGGIRNFNSQPKKQMVKTLRNAGNSNSSTGPKEKHQANMAANLSWQKPKKDELFGDFDQDFEIKNWEKIQSDEEVNLIDLDPGMSSYSASNLNTPGMNEINRSMENLLKPKNLRVTKSNPNLLERPEKLERESNPSSPNNSILQSRNFSSDESPVNSPINSMKDKKYVYKQPQPMNLNKLMKQTKKKASSSPSIAVAQNYSSSSVPTIQTSSSIPVKKTNVKKNITYNYVPAKPKKQSVRKESPSPEPVSDESDDFKFTDPLLNPKVQDEILKSIRGIDYESGKQILNDIVVHGDEVFWDDIVGLDQAKNSLKEAVVYPFLRPDLFKGLREPIRGMLLFGPPGTGKTMLARAVATESKSTFFSITSSTITSKYLGESEKLVKAMFQLAKKLSPSIVFIDEIDSLLGSRSEGEIESIRRIKNEFLIQWSELSSSTAKETNELNSQVLILGATNLPWSIDEAARRRFVKKQYIPLPEDETRKSQIIKLLKYQNNELSEDDFKQLIDLTKKFSGSDITSLCKDSAMGPLRSLGELLLSTPTEEIRPINIEDFKNSLKYIKPSVSEDSLKKYEEWSIKFGSGI